MESNKFECLGKDQIGNRKHAGRITKSKKKYGSLKDYLIIHIEIVHR
jgi:hypothetical protein